MLDKHAPHLCQFAFSILRKHDLAQEAVANVFIKIWQRRQVLLIDTKVRIYLFTAISHQALNLLRNQIRLNEISIDDVPPQDLMDDSVDHESQYQEVVDEIEAVLKTMPSERQQVFRMNHFENLRYKDIAAALGISVSKVQKHIIAARQQITAALPDFGRRPRKDTG